MSWAEIENWMMVSVSYMLIGLFASVCILIAVAPSFLLIHFVLEAVRQWL